MAPDTASIGVTAVGSGIGHSVVQSCRMTTSSRRVIGFDTSPMAFDAYDCDEHYILPPSTDPTYVGTLSRLCQEHGIRILIPGLDMDVLILTEHAKVFEKIGIVVLTGDTGFVRLCRDKLAWSRTLHSLCPAIVPTWTPEEIPALAQAGHLTYPLLAKPANGSGSAGIRVLRNAGDLARLSQGEIVQPFVFPSGNDPLAPAVARAVSAGIVPQLAEISLQLAFSPHGRLLGSMASRNRLKNGVPVEIIPTEPGPFTTALAPALAYLLEQGMRGPVNFQGRMTDAGPRFFEMNGRFTGITALRAMLGYNEVEALIESFLGLDENPLRALRLNPRKIGLRQVADRVVSPRSYPLLRQHITSPPHRAMSDDRINVLVTGAGGWLGRHLVAALQKHARVGHVTAIVRSVQQRPALWGSGNKIEVIETTRTPLSERQLAHADLVYHLAFARPSGTPADLAESLASTRDLVTRADRVQVPAFVYGSSQAVYGCARPPLWPETLPPAPETPYGMAKLAGEELVLMLKERSRSSRVTSLRLARMYGQADGLRWEELPHRFAQQAADCDPLIIKGGDQRFDLLHIRDAVNALLCFLDAKGPWSESVFNVGSGQPVSILDVAAAAANSAHTHTGKRPEIRVETSPPTRICFGMGIERFHHATGWQPSVELPMGMDELVSSCRACARTAEKRVPISCTSPPETPSNPVRATA